MTFRLKADARFPKYQPVTGWRWLLTVVGLLPRARFIVHTADNYLVYHPDNFAVLRQYLDQNGFIYQVEQPNLRTIK